MNAPSEWYEGPEIATPEALADLVGAYRPDSLIVSYAYGLENRAYKKGLSHLTAREQLVVAGAVFEREINSGGLQSFLEDYAAYHDAAKLSLKTMGHNTIAEIVDKALHVAQSVGSEAEALDALNEDYYALGVDLAEDLIRLATG